MNWTRKMLIAAVATAAVAVPLVIPGAHADTTALGGYQMNATADAISMLIDSPSFGVPAPHTFELHKAHSTTAIDLCACCQQTRTRTTAAALPI